MFFRPFAKVPYSITDDGQTSSIVDIFKYVSVDSLLMDAGSSYMAYEINDGARPDVLSTQLYGTPEYYWTFFVINEHLSDGLESWPLSGEDFEKWTDLAFEGYVVCARPKIKRNTDGQIIEFTDSIAGLFAREEPVIGSKSGCKGKILGRNPQYNQLFISDIEELSAEEVAEQQRLWNLDPKEGNGWTGGPFKDTDRIVGQQTSDSFFVYKSWPWKHAPLLYKDDEGNIVDNGLFITGAVANGMSEGLTFLQQAVITNDQQRQIRVLRPEVIDEFVSAYKKKIRGEK